MNEIKDSDINILTKELSFKTDSLAHIKKTSFRMISSKSDVIKTKDLEIDDLKNEYSWLSTL